MRLYTVIFNNVSVAAVQDLISVTCTANMAIKIHEVAIGQVTATTIGNLRISLKRMQATVTAGSGGTAYTPVPINFGDAAATATARVNDTTQAISSTGAQIMRADIYNVLNGFLYLPPIEDRIIIKPSQAFVVSLDSAPGSAEIMSCSLVFEELF